MKLPCQRSLFEIPNGVTYLNCAAMSPQLRAVREAGERAILRKTRPWELNMVEINQHEPETVRELFARLVHADADGVALVPSTSYGVGLAAANLPVRKGQSILVMEEEFPSNVYPWMELARDRGAKLVTVPRPTDHDWTRAFLDRIDSSTAIVAAAPCHWTDGARVDLKSLREATRDANAALAIDATQSLGAYPFDVSEIQPDFLVAVTYKWLLGPYSMGFVYVAPEWREGKALEMSWQNRSNSFDHRSLAQYVDTFHPGARRYDVGERGNLVLLPMVKAGLEQLHAWGVENVHETVRGLTRSIIAAADRLGFEAIPSEKCIGHIVGLRSKDGVPAGAVEKLADRKVYISQRGDCLRISPHIYNTPKDIERFLAELAEIRPS